MKTSTALARELDFQGLVGLGSVYVCCFFGVGFGMALGMNFEMILGWILGAFWLRASMKNAIDFGSDF